MSGVENLLASTNQSTFNFAAAAAATTAALKTADGVSVVVPSNNTHCQLCSANNLQLLLLLM